MWDTLDQNRIESELALKRIKCKFITNGHHGEVVGGNNFVEQSKNHCTRSWEKHYFMKFTELNTSPVNIEGVFKTTDKDKALALIAVSDDHRVPSPITPAHLAIGRPLNQLPDVSLC